MNAGQDAGAFQPLRCPISLNWLNCRPSHTLTRTAADTIIRMGELCNNVCRATMWRVRAAQGLRTFPCLAKAPNRRNCNYRLAVGARLCDRKLAV